MKSARLLLPLIDIEEKRRVRRIELINKINNLKPAEEILKQSIEKEIEELNSLIPKCPELLILDVGCFTQEAKKYYPPWVRYLGIDAASYHQETKVVDLNHGFLPIPCSHALCLETLEHLLDPMDTLRSISESLSHGGYLVVSLPNEATIFHRIRSLLGTVDAECFSGEGKHLHLPSLSQSREFLRKIQELELQKELYYISPTACGTRGPVIVGKILSLIHPHIHQFLADRFPSLFSRGFIFLLKKTTPDNTLTQDSAQSQPS